MQTLLNHLAFVFFLKLQFFWNMLNVPQVKTTNINLECKCYNWFDETSTTSLQLIVKCYILSLFKVPQWKWKAFVIILYYFDQGYSEWQTCENTPFL